MGFWGVSRSKQLLCLSIGALSDHYKWLAEIRRSVELFLKYLSSLIRTLGSDQGLRRLCLMLVKIVKVKPKCEGKIGFVFPYLATRAIYHVGEFLNCCMRGMSRLGDPACRRKGWWSSSAAVAR